MKDRRYVTNRRERVRCRYVPQQRKPTVVPSWPRRHLVDLPEREAIDVPPPGWRSWPAIRAAAMAGEDICGAPWVDEVLDKLRALAAEHPANSRGEFISPRLLDVGLRELALGLTPARQWLDCMRRELELDGAGEAPCSS